MDQKTYDEIIAASNDFDSDVIREAGKAESPEVRDAARLILGKLEGRPSTGSSTCLGVYCSLDCPCDDSRPYNRECRCLAQQPYGDHPPEERLWRYGQSNFLRAFLGLPPSTLQPDVKEFVE